MVCAVVASVLAVSCGGSGNETAAPTSTANTVSGTGTAVTPSTVTATTARTAVSTSAVSTTTTVSPIQGVETSAPSGGHREGPLTYPEVPPIGGDHNPVWTRCAFYDRAVPNEMAVHSLEHGAVWITYRPDLPQDQLDVLIGLAGSRKKILVSRWDDGLPAPLVVTAWGRQLRLTTATDPRLADFERLYANGGPEPTAPC